MREYGMPSIAGMLSLYADMPRPIGRPVFQPRRKKLKGWQKEMRRNNPKRFFKGKKR